MCATGPRPAPTSSRSSPPRASGSAASRTCPASSSRPRAGRREPRGCGRSSTCIGPTRCGSSPMPGAPRSSTAGCSNRTMSRCLSRAACISATRSTYSSATMPSGVPATPGWVGTRWRGSPISRPPGRAPSSCSIGRRPRRAYGSSSAPTPTPAAMARTPTNWWPTSSRAGRTRWTRWCRPRRSPPSRCVWRTGSARSRPGSRRTSSRSTATRSPTRLRWAGSSS